MNIISVCKGTLFYTAIFATSLFVSQVCFWQLILILCSNALVEVFFVRSLKKELLFSFFRFVIATDFCFDFLCLQSQGFGHCRFWCSFALLSRLSIGDSVVKQPPDLMVLFLALYQWPCMSFIVTLLGHSILSFCLSPAITTINKGKYLLYYPNNRCCKMSVTVPHKRLLCWPAADDDGDGKALSDHQLLPICWWQYELIEPKTGAH